MDIERTLQELLENHVRAIERMDRADRRMDRADRRMDRADKRMDRFDKQLQATANLVRGGMKLIIEDRKRQKKENADLRDSINALVASQMRTEEQAREHAAWLRKHDEIMRKNDEKFNRLLEQLRRQGKNGRN